MADDDKQGDGFDPWAELESTPGPDSEGGFDLAFDEAAESQGGELPPAPPSAEHPGDLDVAAGEAHDADAAFGGSDDEISDWLADVADAEVEPTSLGVFSGDDDATFSDVSDPEAVRVGFGESGILDDDTPVSATDPDGVESPAAADTFGWGEVEIESPVESAPFGVVGADLDDHGGEAAEFDAAAVGEETDDGGFTGGAGDLAMAAAGGAAAIVTGTKPPSRQRATKRGLGQIIGIALGGLLALPITFAILIWGFRKDPLQIVRHVPESMAFLFPQELVAGDRPMSSGVGGGATLDDVPAVASVEDAAAIQEEPVPQEPVGEPAAQPDGQDLAAVDGAPVAAPTDPVMPADAADPEESVGNAPLEPMPAEPAGESAAATASVDAPQPADTPLPTDTPPSADAPMPAAATVDPFADLTAPLASEPPATVAPQEAVPPPSPEPEPLDLSAVENAVAAADEALRAVEAAGADVDPDPARHARRRNRLLVEWYRQVSLVAEELAAVERQAADTGRPLGGPPEAVSRLQAAAVGDAARLGDLARLSRDWLTYRSRSTSGIMLPAVLSGVRHVGPYWCSTVTVDDSGDRTRDLVVISRSEPAAAPGETVLVTGLIVDGDTLWASDVRPAAAAAAATTGDPFAAPAP
jgi:hypothetical protein